MAQGRYPPRQMELGDLIKVLVEEHVTMKEGLSQIRDALYKSDYEKVSAAVRRIGPIFRQHIADEEGQILRLLIAELGVGGAEEAIRVFQQHRPIYKLMQVIESMTTKTPPDLENQSAELNALFYEHAAAEEGRVFPKAMACYEGREEG